MGHYRSNVRDLEFNLFEVFALPEKLGKGSFEQVDEDCVRSILRSLNELATGPLAKSFEDADRNPPIFDPITCSVTLPDSLKDSYHELWSGEWYRLSLPRELGGFGVPPTVQWAGAELLLGCNAPLYMYFSAMPMCAEILFRNGTAQQKKWAEIMINRGWGATMVITEPDAGSDVGACRTKAVWQEGGHWYLDGVKRFITSGDQDITENILHVVLARPEGSQIEPRPGTKGLSVFVVPKYLFDPETGERNGRNGVYVTRVERKMGLRASTTCELAFGQHGAPAKGWLLGEVHDGIAQIFQVISWARMTVGIKAIATLSTGYLNALEFAKQRVQGTDLQNVSDKSAPRVAITRHPDVRRLLMLQKAYSEGLRAVYLYTATFQDTIHEKMGNTAFSERVHHLLLPIVKGVGSERVYEHLAHALQVLGGSGFLQEFPIEQYIRDSKIDSLFEGTTAIQSLDFFFRQIAQDDSKALWFIFKEIERFLDSQGESAQLTEERGLLKQALDDMQAMVHSMIGFCVAAEHDPRNIYKVGQNSVRLLLSTGDLLVGWLLLRQATIAIAALDGAVSAKDKWFYEGKVAAASFFAKTILPELTASRKIIGSTDGTLMDIDEEAF